VREHLGLSWVLTCWPSYEDTRDSVQPAGGGCVAGAWRKKKGELLVVQAPLNPPPPHRSQRQGAPGCWGHKNKTRLIFLGHNKFFNFRNGGLFPFQYAHGPFDDDGRHDRVISV
jgi:hypothetical protein